MKKRSKKRDAQVREFHARDLGRDLAASRSAVVIKPKVRQMPTSILLDPAIINKLREKAASRGIGYQTMLKIIVHEHVDEY
jgi:hypothetical protein